MNGDCLPLVMLTLSLAWPRPQRWVRSCPRWLAPSAGSAAGRFHSPASWSGWSPPSPDGCWKGCWDWSTGCNWWAASEKKRRTPPGSCGTKWANQWVHGQLIPSYSQNLQLSATSGTHLCFCAFMTKTLWIPVCWWHPEVTIYMMYFMWTLANKHRPPRSPNQGLMGEFSALYYGQYLMSFFNVFYFQHTQTHSHTHTCPLVYVRTC